MQPEEGLVRFLSNGVDANEFKVQGINFSRLDSPFQPIFWICTMPHKSKKRMISRASVKVDCLSNDLAWTRSSGQTQLDELMLRQDCLSELTWASSVGQSCRRDCLN